MRRESPGPARQRAQGFGLTSRRTRNQRQRWDQCAGDGRPHAGLHPARLRRRVSDPNAPGLDDGARRAPGSVGFERQKRQMER